MKPNRNQRFVARSAVVLAVAALGVNLLTPVVRGAHPLDPLPTPFYSFDLVSPQVTTTGAALHADDVLELPPKAPSPQPPRSPRVSIAGAALGMGLEGDELDGLSFANRGVPMTASLALLVSVDRATVGQAAAEPALVNMGLPYNVQDQAMRGQAAGDLFMTTHLFTRNGMIPALERLLGGNTALVINNYDEGGTEFSALPAGSAASNASDPQDEVDAAASTNGMTTNGVRGFDPPPILYYSASRASPSLGAPGHLPGNSGADLFAKFVMEGTAPFAYVLAADLGLHPLDDIDALLVFDDGQPGVFDIGDQVIVSLTSDSPSLKMIPDGSAADIISIAKNATGVQITLFARALDLGLGSGAGSPDNVDALEFFFCSDEVDCARRHAIRRVGDMNRDQKVDLFDAHGFWSCFTGPGQPAPSACQGPFDTDLDTDVDLADWDLVRHDMTGPL